MHSRLLVATLAACALVGIVLAVDALRAGGLVRYELAGVLLGGCLCLPAAITLALRRAGPAFLRRCAFALLPAVALLLLLELLLRLVGFGAEVSMRVVASEHLGHALQPGLGGADGNGFRNPAALARADVVFVGDSQTYGFGLTPTQSFPFVFAAATGSSAYSMSLGGYGPVQYRELAKQALRLRPQAVAVCFYFGNDLVDAFLYAHLDCAADLRRAGVDYPRHTSVDIAGKPAPNLAVGALEAVAQVSRLVGTARRLAASWLRGRGIWDAEPAAPCWQEGGVATRFTPEYRLRAVDRGDAGVAEGLRLTDLCLRDIAAACAGAGARAMLVPLHTKEYCYQLWLAGDHRELPQLTALFAAEQAAADDLLAIGRRHGFAIADPTPALVAALAAAWTAK